MEQDNGAPLSGRAGHEQSQQAVSAVPVAIPSAVMWPLRITTYQPSHRQFRLDESLTPEQITKAVGAPPIERDGERVTLEWKFWAEATFPKPEGGHLSTSIGCKIWDYKGSRWSAYGWPEAFEAIGLTPLLTQDYGSWQFEEDGNETLRWIAQAMSAGTAETQSGSGRQPASAVGNADAPEPPSHSTQGDSNV